MKTNGNGSGVAAQRVAELERQVAALRVELEKLKRLKFNPKEIDASSANHGRRLAIEGALVQLEEELAALQQDADVERQAELDAAQQAEYTAAKNEAAAAVRALAGTLADLDDRLRAIDAAAVRLRRAGGYDPLTVEMRGVQALAGGLRTLRTVWSQGAVGRALLKLEPRPDAEAVLLSETRAHVARCEALLASAKRVENTPEMARSRALLIRDLCVGVYGARCTLAQLEGRTPKRMTAAELDRWGRDEAGGGTWIAHSIQEIEDRANRESTIALGGYGAA